MSNPRYPVYIISKGRWESRFTSKSLEAMGVPYSIVVEPQEYDQYAAVIDPAKIYVLPFSNLGLGSIPARNWVWEHSIAAGAERHWILDDNLREFEYLTDNRYHILDSGIGFWLIEDFVDRYTNVAFAGPQYRWRGRYNEDTDLSLRALKDGWCTVLFNTFLTEKQATMTMKGGNTDELYAKDGRYQMALSLQQQHPDVAKIVWKWGRWQHQVDYRRFRNNQLRRKHGIVIPEGVNNYGIELLSPAATTGAEEDGN